MKQLKKLLLTTIISAIIIVIAVFSVSALNVGTVSSVKAETTKTTVTLSWKKSKNAKGYRVYEKISGDWKAIGTITSTSFETQNLKAGTKHTYAVKAYGKEDGKRVWSKELKTIETATRPAAVKEIKSTPTENSVTLKWSKVRGATGYRVYKYNASEEKWETVIKSVSMTTATVKNLTEDKSYTFSVKPYIELEGDTVWGSRKKIKVKTKTGCKGNKPHDYTVISEKSATLLAGGERVEKCSRCKKQKVTELKIIDPTSLDIPVIYIDDYVKGEIPLTKLQKSDNEILVKYRYVSNSKEIESFDCFCEIKIQGASSSRYPKKNFTVKFFEDSELEDKFKVDLGWGEENKYCMKANYIDSSQARNIVGARIFAEIVQTRKNINPGLEKAPNYGLIDGYPVLVYINDKFHGIYTMNIPKDEWMFGMEGEEGSKEAMLMADRWTDSVQLFKPIDKTYVNSGWEVEYCSTENDAWVRESFNKLIALLNCGNNSKIKKELPKHLDIEAAIDNMLFTYYISAADNLAKNILWVTYDGKIWIPSMYDMDGTFGIYWDGSPISKNYTKPSLNESGQLKTKNRLYRILIKLYGDEVESRWAELRENVLTSKNTNRYFKAFLNDIPEVAFISEYKKWSGIPSAEKNQTSMYKFTKQHIARLDKFFNNFND